MSSSNSIPPKYLEGETNDEITKPPKINVETYIENKLEIEYKDCYAEFEQFKKNSRDIDKYILNIDNKELVYSQYFIHDPYSYGSSSRGKYKYYVKESTTCYFFSFLRLSDFFLQEFSKLKKELEKEDILVSYKIIFGTNSDSSTNYKKHKIIKELIIIAKPLPHKVF